MPRLVKMSLAEELEEDFLTVHAYQVKNDSAPECGVVIIASFQKAMYAKTETEESFCMENCSQEQYLPTKDDIHPSVTC